MRHARRRLRPFLVPFLAPLLALAEPLEAAAPDSTATCLEQVQQTVPKNKRLRVLLVEGGSVEGDYRGVTGSSLELRTYERSGSRFLTKEFPEASISTIQYESKHLYAFPIVFGAVLGGGAGFILGNAFDENSDGGETSPSARAAFGVLGLVVGGLFGLLISSAFTPTKVTEFSCGGVP
jgi:hypothetical protein